VPFRAGDWKCGSEGCGYHNFACRTACLRCGSARSNAALVADASGAMPGVNGQPFGLDSAPSPFSQGSYRSQQNVPSMNSTATSLSPISTSSFPPLNSSLSSAFGGGLSAGGSERLYSNDGYENGGYSSQAQSLYNFPGDDAPSFLSGSLGGLALSDEEDKLDRRAHGGLNGSGSIFSRYSASEIA